MTTSTTEEPKKKLGQSRIAKLILAENDAATMELLTDHLTRDQYEVLNAPTAADAIRLCEHNSPDLILLDLNIGEKQEIGLDVLREIRALDSSSSSVGVILLSGRGTERDRVRGLELGADDYVTKPYPYGELLARIGAVLRRRGYDKKEVIRVGDLVINKTDNTVKVGDRSVELSVKEFSLLAYLATEPTRLFSREECLREVWGYRSLGHTRTLDTHAARLRTKLDPDAGRFVRLIWGVGYKLTDND